MLRTGPNDRWPLAVAALLMVARRVDGRLEETERAALLLERALRKRRVELIEMGKCYDGASSRGLGIAGEN